LDFAQRHGRPGDPVAAVAAACGRLLSEADPDEPSRPVATDLDAVSRKLGIDPSTYEYGAIEGTARLVRGRNGKATIQINERENAAYPRLRFSVAHELAHLYLRRKARPLSATDQKAAALNHREEEVLCQLIASEILMPAGRFGRFVTARWEGAFTTALVHDIARAFVVSRFAVVNRIALLSPGGQAVYWGYGPHPKHRADSEPDLRVRWAFPQAPLRLDPFVPYHATAKEGRFIPNLPRRCFDLGYSARDRIEVRGFGGLSGRYDVLVINLHEQGLFNGETAPPQRARSNFDLVTLFMPVEEGPVSQATARESGTLTAQGQLELFA
jgi:hypothetical protein